MTPEEQAKDLARQKLLEYRRQQANKEPEYLCSKKITDISTRVALEFFSKIPKANASKDTVVLSSRVPIRLIQAVLDPSNWQYLLRNPSKDGVRVFLRNILASGAVDCSLVALSCGVEWLYDKLNFYCQADGFNTLANFLKQFILDQEAVFTFVCEHPQLVSGFAGGIINFVAQSFCQWWKGRRVQWTDNLLASALNATTAAVLAPYITTTSTLVIGMVICTAIGSAISVALNSGGGFLPQVVAAVTDLPCFLWEMIRPGRATPALPSGYWDIPDADAVPSEMTCPISLTMMVSPALLYGVYYEYEKIYKWVLERKVDPFHRAATVSDIVLCPNMEAIINSYAVTRGYVLNNA